MKERTNENKASQHGAVIESIDSGAICLGLKLHCITY